MGPTQKNLTKHPLAVQSLRHPPCHLDTQFPLKQEFQLAVAPPLLFGIHL